MANPSKMSNTPNAASLSADEVIDVEKKVKFQLANFQHKVVNIAGILNPISGLFIVLTLYNKTSLTFLLSWFFALFTFNAINVVIGYRNRNITPEQVIPWRNALRSYHVMIMLLTLAYGCVGILYTSSDVHYQLFTITFLEFLIMGFNIGTITDMKACIISNICLLIPYISWSFCALIYPDIAPGRNIALNFSFGITLIILALFFSLSTYAGYILIKKFFWLSFEKVILSGKLEDANKFLEQRVKERTIELENSLKLVTHQATHDLLTNLPNQRLLVEKFQATIETAYKYRKMFAVVCISLNELGKINDALGHQAEDLVIKLIAQRFRLFIDKANANNSAIRNIIALTRKDIFVVIMPVSQIEKIEEEMSALFSIVKNPITIYEQSLRLTMSIGISTFPNDGEEVKSLLMNAEASLSRAKQQGGNSLNIYKTEMNADTHQILEIENQLHSALKNNEFKLLYQPVINLKTGKIHGCEALIRWHNPVLGMVSPDKFIPIAEADGVIIPVGEWVLRTACAQIKLWHDLGFPALKISINLSAKQLHQKNLVQVVADVLNENKLDPAMIELELTETAAFQKETIPIIKELKMLGINISIDDFGTGYSGLSNLKLFTIDKLKIDKSFVRDLAINNDSKAIVSNTIMLAKKINVEVTAEGVETEEQLNFLYSNGCNLIQGYYFSQPVDAEEFLKLLQNKSNLKNKILTDIK